MIRQHIKTGNSPQGSRPSISSNGAPPPADFQSQLDALKVLVTAQAAQITELQSQLANKAILPTMDAFDQSISDPPTQTDIQNLVDWLNEVLGQLEGTP